MIKFKKGERCLISQFTWDSMSQQDRDQYSEHPEGAGVYVQSISLNPDGSQEIKKIEFDNRDKPDSSGRINLKSKEVLELEAMNAELVAQLKALKESKEEKIEIFEESKEVDPLELDIDGLKAWLTLKGVEFSQRITKLETLQKFIP